MNRRQFILKGAGLGGLAAGSAIRLPSTQQACVLAAQQVFGEGLTRTPAKGPLRVLKANPRYFTDGSGKAVYLAGSSCWCCSAPEIMTLRRYLITGATWISCRRTPIICSGFGGGKLPSGRRTNPGEISNIAGLTLGYVADQGWQETASPNLT